MEVISGFDQQFVGVDARDEGSSWLERIACRDVNPEIFFPEGRVGSPVRVAKESMAKTICAACVVRIDCLNNALQDEADHVWRYGIRGGLNEDERTALVGRTRRTR